MMKVVPYAVQDVYPIISSTQVPAQSEESHVPLESASGAVRWS